MENRTVFDFIPMADLVKNAKVSETLRIFIMEYNLEPLQGVLVAIVALPVLFALRRAVGVLAFILRLVSEIAVGVSGAGLLLISATIGARVAHARGAVTVPDAFFAFLADQTVLLALTLAIVVANMATRICEPRYRRSFKPSSTPDSL